MRLAFAIGMSACFLFIGVNPELRADEQRGGEEHATAEVRLLDAGAEPRTVLRYKPEPGTAQAIVLKVTLEAEQAIDGGRPSKLSMPDPVIRQDLCVDAVAPNGDIDCRLVLREIDRLDADRLRPARAAEYRDRMARLRGATFHLTVDDRGRAGTFRVEAPDYLSAEIEKALGEVEQQVRSTAFLLLPREPVGAGARWSVTAPGHRLGLASGQTVTATLVKREGPELHLSLSLTEAAGEAALELPSLPAGAAARIVRHSTKGGGESRLTLSALAPIEMNLELNSEAAVEIETDGKTRLLDLEMSAKMTLTSRPVPLAKPAPSPEPPRAEDAVRYVRRLLERAAAGRSDAFAGILDAETVTRRAIGPELDALTAPERNELRVAYGAGPALESGWFEAWQGGLRTGALRVETVETAPPRRDRIKVTTVFAAVPPAEDGCRVSWILRKTDAGPKVVDHFDEEGRSVLDWMRRERLMLGAKALSPLVRTCRALGLPLPLGAAETRPPEGDVPSWTSLDALRLPVTPPVVPGTAADPAGGSPDARMALHLDGFMGVYYRPAGRSSLLDRAELTFPRRRRDALDEVGGAVRKAAATAGEGGLRVLVRADRNLRWQYTTWTLATVWSSGVRNLALGVADPDGAHAVIPLSAVVVEDEAGTAPKDGPRVNVVWMVTESAEFPRLELPGDRLVDLPRGDARVGSSAPVSESDPEWANVRNALRDVVEEQGGGRWSVAAPAYPHRHPFWRGKRKRYFGSVIHTDVVALVLQMLLDAGVEELEIVAQGVPKRPPPDPRPEAPGGND